MQAATRFRLSLPAFVVAVTLTSGCARLGYTNRVLHRVPSPDGAHVAACQEVPEFDGPGYEIRLERPDGTLVRGLYDIGDGDPCSELAWSPDGQTLAVLSAHVGRVRFVDVSWALGHPDLQTTAHSWRWEEAGSGSGLRFADSYRVVIETPLTRVVRVPHPAFTIDAERQASGASKMALPIRR